MNDDTPKPVNTPSAAAEASAAKPAARPRTTRAAGAVAAKPARKRAAPTSRAATPAARKPARTKAAPKPAPARKAAPAAKPIAASTKKDKPAKAKKVKLVRDSFTMPDTEYAAIAALKKRCLKAGVSAKKSEILRAAIAGLAKLSDTSVLAAIRRLDVIKTGRPAKGSK